jgi:hypothetical protein
MFGKSKRKLATINETMKEKRVKTTDTNSNPGKLNTLFNYFKSNKTNEEKNNDNGILHEVLEIDCNIETEIDEKKKLEVIDLKKESNTADTEIKTEAKQAWSKIFEKPVNKPSQIKTEIKDIDEKVDEEKSQNYNRKCPFYKFITSKYFSFNIQKNSIFLSI